MLDCLPVQSFHNSTANFRVHASITFLVNGDERPLLMVCFLKRLETSPCRWRWFCSRTINRLCHAFPRTQNIFTNGALIPKIYSACSFADTMFFSGNFGETLLCFTSFKALPRENLHILVFQACAPRPKVASVSSSTKASATFWKNRKGCVCLFFHDRASGTFERLSIFPEHPINYSDFKEQIRHSRNGRYVCFLLPYFIRQRKCTK